MTTKLEKHDQMYAQIRQHGHNLINAYDLPALTDPVKLCKRLRLIERKAKQLATDYCNGKIDLIGWEREVKKIKTKVKLILGDKLKGFFVNSDPRGYALKIDDEIAKDMTIYRDVGGYGILAPDFS